MIINANALHIPLADNSVQCVVTSPPYYGLRDYGVDGQIGLEQTPEEYVAALVEVFREVRRVLREDGTCWVNLGDSYAGSGKGIGSDHGKAVFTDETVGNKLPVPTGLKPKDLVGIPWRVAFALQADGWWLRSDIVWAKPNPMPESVTDRPTKAHEYMFLLTKSPRYYFDQDAVREPANYDGRHDEVMKGSAKYEGGFVPNQSPQTMQARGHERWKKDDDGVRVRNIRTVWTIATQPTPYAHFATFPEKLVEPCIKAGTSERGRCPKCGKPWARVVEKPIMIEVDSSEIDRYGNGAAGVHRKVGQKYQDWRSANPDKTTGWQPGCACDAGNPVPCIVFDPFMGSGTVERVAIKLRRLAIGTELSYKYIRDIASIRTSNIQPVMIGEV